MRASPPLLIQLDTFRVWRGGIATLGLFATATLLAWAITAPEQRTGTAWVVFAIGVAAVAAITRWLWIVPARSRQLLWDGQAWHVSTIRAGKVDAALTGRIDIAVDAGAWMLLQFHPDAWRATRVSRRRVIWLPAERRSAPLEWHALRYTLYGNAQRSRTDKPALGQGPTA